MLLYFSTFLIIALNQVPTARAFEDKTGMSKLPVETQAVARVLINGTNRVLIKPAKSSFSEPDWLALENVPYSKSIVPEEISIAWAIFRPDVAAWYFVRRDAPGLWTYALADNRLRSCWQLLNFHQMLSCNVAPDRKLVALGQQIRKELYRSRLVIVAIGTGELLFTIESGRECPMCAWSPDSRSLLADCGPDEIQLFGVGTRKGVKIAKGYGPSWSPDGVFVVWSPVRSQDDLRVNGAPIAISRAAQLSNRNAQNESTLAVWRTVKSEDGSDAQRNDFCDLTWLDNDHFVWYPQKVGKPTPIFAYSVRDDRSLRIGQSHSMTGSLGQLGSVSLYNYIFNKNKSRDP